MNQEITTIHIAGHRCTIRGAIRDGMPIAEIVAINDTRTRRVIFSRQDRTCEIALHVISFGYEEDIRIKAKSLLEGELKVKLQKMDECKPIVQEASLNGYPVDELILYTEETRRSSSPERIVLPDENKLLVLTKNEGFITANQRPRIMGMPIRIIVGTFPITQGQSRVELDIHDGVFRMHAYRINGTVEYLLEMKEFDYNVYEIVTERLLINNRETTLTPSNIISIEFS